MSTYEDLWQKYVEAEEELERAMADEKRIEGEHTISSGEGAIRFLRVSAPEVQGAWERTRAASNAVYHLRQQLLERL